MSEPTLFSTQDTPEIHNCETLSAGHISLQRRFDRKITQNN